MPTQSMATRMSQLPASEVAASVARLDTLARVLDSVVAIPGTDIRIGVDALMGLVPVVGDAVASAISGYLIWEARRLGASRWTLTRMLANTALDATVGAVPVLGDAFDVAYRSNLRNMTLLRRDLERRGLLDAGAPVIEGDYEVVGRG